MIYNVPAFFLRETPGAYDPESGNYGESTFVETKRYASVTSSGVETLKLIYGEVKQGSLTIRLQRPYTEPFDFIRIHNTVYRADFSRLHKTFVLSEVE